MRKCIILEEKEFEIQQSCFFTNCTIESTCLFIGEVKMDNCVVMSLSQVQAGKYENTIFHHKTKTTTLQEVEIKPIIYISEETSNKKHDFDNDTDSSDSEILNRDLNNIKTLTMRDNGKKLTNMFNAELFKTENSEL